MKINYENNTYTLSFCIDNVVNLINMNLIYLFFELNKNIIDDKIINDDNAIFLIKHLFKDIGVKQQYLKVNMTHDMDNSCFYIKTQKDLVFDIPQKSELLNMDVLIKYAKLTESNYSFNVIIKVIDSQINIEDFNLDKIIGKFIIKLFNNLKEYIERNIC